MPAAALKSEPVDVTSLSSIELAERRHDLMIRKDDLLARLKAQATARTNGSPGAIELSDRLADELGQVNLELNAVEEMDNVHAEIRRQEQAAAAEISRLNSYAAAQAAHGALVHTARAIDHMFDNLAILIGHYDKLENELKAHDFHDLSTGGNTNQRINFANALYAAGLNTKFSVMGGQEKTRMEDSTARMFALPAINGPFGKPGAFRNFRG